jgi:hypothetical protein
MFLQLNLTNLSSIRGTVNTFLTHESQLHGLFNNVRVLMMADDVVFTPQGHELQCGASILGTFLLTRLLTPTIAAMARVEPLGTVRVAWVTSFSTEAFAGDRAGRQPKKLLQRTGWWYDAVLVEQGGQLGAWNLVRLPSKG